MSFNRYKKLIEDGDTVILYMGFNRMSALKIKRGETHQTRFGAVKHNDLIGSEFGSQVKCSKGWLYILHPTPELWTLTLPHRTQILYTTDISMITLQLELKPGSSVVEAGVGSGSLSHALMRAIVPTGHLYTFDFHAERADLAQKEFADHGYGSMVTVQHRDVCNEGFGLEGVANAVFLDLPRPWEALPHAKKTLKKAGGRICSFSPCIEQVQRTCLGLQELGFCEIDTLECLVRNYNMITLEMPVQDMGFVEENYLDTKTGEPSVGSIVRANKNNGQKISANDGVKMETEENEEAEIQKILEPSMKSYSCKSAAPVKSIPGHTGYLTFATATALTQMT